MRLSIFTILCAAFCFFHTSSSAQYSQRWDVRVDGTADSNEVCSGYYKKYILQTDSGFIYAASESMRGAQQDILIAKLDSAGNLLWQRRFDNITHGIDEFGSMAVDATGNLFVIGSRKLSSTNWDVEVIKYSAGGNMLWSNDYSSSPNAGIDKGSDLYISPVTNDIYFGLVTYYNSVYYYGAVRWSSGATLLSNPSYNGGTGNYAYPNHLRADKDGNIYITGQWRNQNNNLEDGVLMKFNPSLSTVLWMKEFNGTNNGQDYFYDLAIDHNDCAIVVGDDGEGLASQKFLIVKYDTAGNVMWSDSYSILNASKGCFKALDIDSSNNIYLTGESDSAGVRRLTTVRYNASGTMNWRRYDPFISVDAAANAIDFKAGRVASFGYTTAVDTSGLIQVYDSLGNNIWLHEFSQANGTNAYFAGVLDATGNIYCSGFAMGAASGSDLWVQKYAPPGSSGVPGLQAAEMPFDIYPNPTNGTVQFSTPVKMLLVYDSQGSLVMKREGQSISLADLSSLSAGVYFIRTDLSARWSKVSRY
jgi:hypothetical protein